MILVNHGLAGTYSKFDFRSTDTTGSKLKILTALGECIIKEDSDDANVPVLFFCIKGEPVPLTVTVIGPLVTVKVKLLLVYRTLRIALTFDVKLAALNVPVGVGSVASPP